MEMNIINDIIEKIDQTELVDMSETLTEKVVRTHRTETGAPVITINNKSVKNYLRIMDIFNEDMSDTIQEHTFKKYESGWIKQIDKLVRPGCFLLKLFHEDGVISASLFQIVLVSNYKNLMVLRPVLRINKDDIKINSSCLYDIKTSYIFNTINETCQESSDTHLVVDKDIVKKYLLMIKKIVEMRLNSNY